MAFKLLRTRSSPRKITSPKTPAHGGISLYIGDNPSRKCSLRIRRFRLPRASLVTQLVKNPPATWETWVRSLGWEDPLEKGKATHSSILAWRIPWTVHVVAKSQT